MDWTLKLNTVINSDPEITKEVSCTRTKTKAIVNNVLAPHSVAMALQYLNYLGVSTQGNIHGSLKLFPVVIQYLHKVKFIESELIDLNDMINEKSEMTANCVTQTLKDHCLLTKCYGLGWQHEHQFWRS